MSKKSLPKRVMTPKERKAYRAKMKEIGINKESPLRCERAIKRMPDKDEWGN